MNHLVCGSMLAVSLYLIRPPQREQKLKLTSTVRLIFSTTRAHGDLSIRHFKFFKFFTSPHNRCYCRDRSELSNSRTDANMTKWSLLGCGRPCTACNCCSSILYSIAARKQETVCHHLSGNVSFNLISVLQPTRLLRMILFTPITVRLREYLFRYRLSRWIV
jgi:hypothetical protein